ncbi:MAG: hypothetical protein JW870_12715 [Candidatus Delongbacteria bacterium]|nr:hypothetical protein [Candidatus Delongbacteria bacterium]
MTALTKKKAFLKSVSENNCKEIYQKVVDLLKAENEPTDEELKNALIKARNDYRFENYGSLSTNLNRFSSDVIV